jgi:hypothetical protein
VEDGDQFDRLAREFVATVGSGIELVGGPMDGWYVKPGTPVFEAQWWKTTGLGRGTYERVDPDEGGTRVAEWVEL